MKNKRYLRYFSTIIYCIIIAGFIFHTSPSSGHRIFDKYSYGYFYFLFCIILLGFIFYCYFFKIKYFIANDYTFVVKKKEFKIKSNHKKTILILLLLFSVFIAELYFTNQDFYIRVRAFHPFLQAQPIASDRKFHINSFGFRGEEIEKEKPNNAIRIFFMGGSSVYSDRTEFENTHARIFEKALRKRFPRKKIEVLNAGFHWYTTEHSIINYLFNIREFKPDIIIMWHGINDLVRSFSPSKFAFGPYKDDYSHYYGAVSNLVFERGIFRCPLVVFRVIRFFCNTFFSDFREITDFKAPCFLERETVKFPSLGAFKRNFELFLEICRRDNVLLIVATQPTLYRDSLSKIERGKIVFPGLFCNTNNEMPSIRSMNNGMQDFNKTVKKLAKEKSVFLIDLDSIVPKTLQYFLDDCHYAKEGHRLISNALYQFFVDNDILGSFESRK